MFTDEPKSDYTRSERVVGNVKEGTVRRGKYGIGRRFIKFVAKQGMGQPAFTNMGRWKSDDASSRGGPVYVPWLTVDIDNVDLVEAHEDALRTIGRLEELGYDLSRVVASFSGNKGFHVQVDSTQMGLPPFMGPRHARLFMRTWIEDVCLDDYFDPSVCTPRSLLRLTGSVHEKSELRKISFFAPEFRRRGIDGIMQEHEGEYRGFTWLEGGDVLPGPRKHLRRVYKRAENNYRGRRSNGAIKPHSQQSAGVLSNIKYGVREGEEFGPRNFHVGRENAAFVIGCKLLEEYEQERVAREKLQQWNGLNSPPLQRTRLEAQWRGAKRKMNKSRR